MTPMTNRIETTLKELHELKYCDRYDDDISSLILNIIEEYIPTKITVAYKKLQNYYNEV